ncbi:lysosomal alpha-mannosidase-like [Cylas formicarius]|uniref:lysosomal alpha-mannosidase-like n=1 Tax=Cylas formicarius TaxID=197179 RepID=UPI002958A906|nr:lysosomal alpha-mannosidase-like [Cylas formicarius]
MKWANTYLTIFIPLIGLISCSLNDEDFLCGYSSCPTTKEGYINIHLVPHSHDDLGWVKTIDQYYYGVHTPVSNVGVQYIYDSVLNSLSRRTDRRFIFVETAYFWKWWTEQDEVTRTDFAELVKRGQLEFVSGGWSMNDEATTNYQSIIDQMSWGLRRLNDTFGKCAHPKVGWQIDPFGHSNEMASIFASLGFDGVFLGRIDYQDRAFRTYYETMEFVWRSSQSLGASSDIFTSVLYDLYVAPTGFCFDVECDDQPIIDDIESPEYNLHTRAQNFTDLAFQRLLSYSTSNVLIPMGNDFAYQDAEMWYKNIDKLIRYINNNTFGGYQYNVMYSTPSCYVKAVHEETKGIIYSGLNTFDFFPYASNPYAFWVGCYTSRPAIKRFERMGNNFLQICKQLSALSNQKETEKLNNLREAMGIMQHHDAITGTETQNVTFDYARILDNGLSDCREVANDALRELTKAVHSKFTTCPLTNISQCYQSEAAKSLVITVYNPLERNVTKYVRLPVTGRAYRVRDPSGNELPVQLLPISSAVLNIPGRVSDATLELIFPAYDVPALGYRSYFMEVIEDEDRVTPVGVSSKYFSTNMGVDFDINEFGFIGKIYKDNLTMQLKQTFQAYKGSTNNSEGVSGAYLFNPITSEPDYIIGDADGVVYNGELITEIHQRFNAWLSQVIRFYDNENFIEFDWIVGPLPTNVTHGTEVISKFTTNLKSDSIFYTDSNGREMMKRIRNHRPTWNFSTILQPPPSNYYPVTSKIVIEDVEENIQLAVLTDRAQGGSSLKDGEIELMIHRNTLVDDVLGMGEPLLEYAHNQSLVVRGSHYVLFDTKNNIFEQRKIAQAKLLDSWVFISSPEEYSLEEYRQKFSMEFSALQNSLPDNVHILTLEPWRESTLLLRLEHIFAKDEDPLLSQPVTVKLNEVFAAFNIVEAKEATLGANQWSEESERLKFATPDGEDVFTESEAGIVELNGELSVLLNPMQIRTFILAVVSK